MKKYKVEIIARPRKYEIIEAENKTEAKMKMFKMLMSYPDFYIEIVEEELKGEEENER